MNPRAKAKIVYEAVAVAIQQREDPIAPIEMALWQIRQEALAEAEKQCTDNNDCEVCTKSIAYLKGKIEF